MQFHGLCKLIQDSAAAKKASPARCLNQVFQHPFWFVLILFGCSVCIYGLVLAGSVVYLHAVTASVPL